MNANKTLWYLNACNCLFRFFYTASGVSTSKYSTSAQRSILEVAKTIIIWAGGLIFLNEQFRPLELIGFGMIVIGNLIYNEVLVIPCCGFDQNTTKAIAERD
jgi:drug/metabolite transporter (DMT)-like permease